MSLMLSVRRSISANAALIPPFEKGGLGGIASCLETILSPKKSPSIPLLQRGKENAAAEFGGQNP
jgi:hypothetical protein